MSSPPSSRTILRFGLFEIDADTLQLSRAGVRLRIQPQPLKVLVALIGRRGEIVTREELRRELWGDQTYVDFEQGLNYCIRHIRAVLRDDAQSPRYIETVPRRGYRFIGSLDQASARENETPSVAEAVSHARHVPGWMIGFAPLLAAAVAIAGWQLYRHIQRASLTVKDSLLVTEFSNSTGDPLFDGTLRPAVSIDLEQSPYLDIVPDEKIRQTLALMSKPADVRITPEIGREVCLRSGTKAMLTGTIASFGGKYLLTINVITAGSGETLAKEAAQVSGKDHILDALGKAADRIRKSLGESLASIQQFGKPLEQVTTSSLEALQLYTLGVEKRDQSELDSVPLFEKALQIDPAFAQAHAILGTVYMNLEQLDLAQEHEKKAMALSGRVSERERLYISAHYYQLIGKRDQVILTYETYARMYPRDAIPEANLANEYILLGRFDEALNHALIALKLDAESADVADEAATAYEGLGRISDAKAVVADAMKYNPKSPYLHLLLSNIALAEGDEATRAREDAVVRSTPSASLDLLYRDAALAASRGRLREAQGLYEQGIQLALKLGLKENASFSLGLLAVYEAYLGKSAEAETSARNALKLSRMSDTIEPVAVALVVAGDHRHAESLIDKLARDRPDDDIVQFVWLPTVHAIVNLSQGNAQAAINALGPAIPYDRGNADAMLARGNAFLKAGRGTEAVEEFRRIVSLRVHSPYDPACALGQLGLARAYALTGQKGASASAYKTFLDGWKDADTDLTVLQQARTEYRKVEN